MKYDIDRDFTHYAGFWRRVLASLIDTVLFLILAVIIHFIFFGGDTEIIATTTDNSFDLQAMGSSNWEEQLILVAITIFMWTKFLGTPGKLMLGCHVVDAKTLGAMSTGQAIIRYLGYFVSAFLLMLGFIWVGIDKRKQGFHDKIARTVVIVRSVKDDSVKNDDSQKTLTELMDEHK